MLWFVCARFSIFFSKEYMNTLTQEKKKSFLCVVYYDCVRLFIASVYSVTLSYTKKTTNFHIFNEAKRGEKRREYTYKHSVPFIRWWIENGRFIAKCHLLSHKMKIVPLRYDTNKKLESWNIFSCFSAFLLYFIYRSLSKYYCFSCFLHLISN